jgi:hypothetical protein
LGEFNASDRKHLVTLQGTPYITVVGLQARLKDQGKSVVRTKSELIQIPADDNGNVAIVRYSIWVKYQDETFGPFESIGDASPKTVNSKLADAIIRMAETRGYGRSLRIATRADYTAMEELPPNE